MANTNGISISASISSTTGGVTTALSKNATLSQTGDNAAVITATAPLSGSSAVAIPVGSLTTYGGYFMIVNVEPTNTTVTLSIYQDGATGTVLIGTIPNGGFMVLTPAAALGIKGSHASLSAAYTALSLEP